MTATMLDRVVRWNLDLDGDLYGDERERFRWYEGMTTAASLHSLLIPWAAAVMVWPLGRSSVLPLAIVLVALWIPLMLSTAYVFRRKVDTTPRSWNAKRIFLTVITALPYAVFAVGAMYAIDPHGSTWKGGAVGSVLGAAIGLGATFVLSRRRRRREMAFVEDED